MKFLKNKIEEIRTNIKGKEISSNEQKYSNNIPQDMKDAVKELLNNRSVEIRELAKY